MLRALFRRFLTPQARRRDRRALPAAFRPRLESLEDRVVPSTVTWVNPGDGDWGVGSNWSSGAAPGSNDDVVINSAVKVTHSSGNDSVHSLTESSGATLDLSGGSLAFATTFQINGALLIDGGTLNLTNKTLAGSGSTTVESGASWTLAHSTINTTLDNQGTLTAKSGVDLTNTFSNDSGATLTVIGDATGTVNFQQLRIANGFTNHGTIELTTDATNHYVTLGVTNGTLTNASDGVIHGLAGGGGETLQTQLDNQGTITADGPLTVSKNGTFTDTNSGTINVNGADMSVSNGTSGTTTFINSGDIEVSSGRTFAVAYNGIRFEEDGTDGGTINGPGTLDLYGTNAVFDGDFTTGTLNILMHFSTTRASGTLTISSGTTLKVLYNATVNADVVNDGTIDLSSIVGTNGCDFTVSGTLTNASDGTILSDVGTGGTRTINARVDNEGTITVNLLLAISDLTNFSNGTLSGGTYDIASTFRFNNAAITTNDATLILDGTNARVVNQFNNNALSGLNANTADGSLTLVNGAALSVASFGNAGYVEIDGSARLTVGGTYTQTAGTTDLGGGTLRAGTLIDIEGGLVEGAGTLDGNVSNAGTLEVGVPGTPGVLAITGNYTQGSGGDLYLEIGGTSAGTDYGQLQVGGTANLDGTLSVVLINGYTPDGQSTFRVLTAGAVNGAFAAVDHDAGLFSVTYDPTDVTLQ